MALSKLGGGGGVGGQPKHISVEPERFGGGFYQSEWVDWKVVWYFQWSHNSTVCVWRCNLSNALPPLPSVTSALFFPHFPPSTGNAVHAVHTQCEVLDIGKYSHPSYLLVVKH